MNVWARQVPPEDRGRDRDRDRDMGRGRGSVSGRGRGRSDSLSSHVGPPISGAGAGSGHDEDVQRDMSKDDGRGRSRHRSRSRSMSRSHSQSRSYRKSSRSRSGRGINHDWSRRRSQSRSPASRPVQRWEDSYVPPKRKNMSEKGVWAPATLGLFSEDNNEDGAKRDGGRGVTLSRDRGRSRSRDRERDRGWRARSRSSSHDRGWHHDRDRGSPRMYGRGAGAGHASPVTYPVLARPPGADGGENADSDDDSDVSSEEWEMETEERLREQNRRAELERHRRMDEEEARAAEEQMLKRTRDEELRREMERQTEAKRVAREEEQRRREEQEEHARLVEQQRLQERLHRQRAEEEERRRAEELRKAEMHKLMREYIELYLRSRRAAKNDADVQSLKLETDDDGAPISMSSGAAMFLSMIKDEEARIESDEDELRTHLMHHPGLLLKLVRNLSIDKLLEAETNIDISDNGRFVADSSVVVVADGVHAAAGAGASTGAGPDKGKGTTKTKGYRRGTRAIDVDVIDLTGVEADEDGVRSVDFESMSLSHSGRSMPKPKPKLKAEPMPKHAIDSEPEFELPVLHGLPLPKYRPFCHATDCTMRTELALPLHVVDAPPNVVTSLPKWVLCEKCQARMLVSHNVLNVLDDVGVCSTADRPERARSAPSSDGFALRVCHDLLALKDRLDATSLPQPFGSLHAEAAQLLANYVEDAATEVAEMEKGTELPLSVSHGIVEIVAGAFGRSRDLIAARLCLIMAGPEYAWKGAGLKTDPFVSKAARIPDDGSGRDSGDSDGDGSTARSLIVKMLDADTKLLLQRGAATITDIFRGTMPDIYPPIPAVNTVDDAPWPAVEFIDGYTRVNVPEPNINFVVGCDCHEVCDDENIHCSHHMDMQPFVGSVTGLPYEDGLLKVNWLSSMTPWPIVECNMNCSCGADCPNRVVQRGSMNPELRFEVRRTKHAGWAVFTLNDIPQGTYGASALGLFFPDVYLLPSPPPSTTVASYVGDLVDLEHEHERDRDRDDSYLFDLDFNKVVGASDAVNNVYSVDSMRRGNVSRFFNHSCDATLLVRAVYVDEPFEGSSVRHQHRLALFAQRDVHEGDELTFNYRYKIAEPTMPCQCGSDKCTGWFR